MPTIDITKNTLRYSAADLTILHKANTLALAIANHDQVAKVNASMASEALSQLIEHVAEQRAK